jgi:hypothetical protein
LKERISVKLAIHSTWIEKLVRIKWGSGIKSLVFHDLWSIFGSSAGSAHYIVEILAIVEDYSLFWYLDDERRVGKVLESQNFWRWGEFDFAFQLNDCVL